MIRTPKPKLIPTGFLLDVADREDYEVDSVLNFDRKHGELQISGRLATTALLHQVDCLEFPEDFPEF